MQSQRTISSQKWLAENLSRITTEPPADQHRAGRDDAADAVIHRQAVVHAVVGRVSIRPANQWLHCIMRPVTDVGGLGQAGGAGGVDQERAIVDGDHPALGRCQRIAGKLLDREVDALVCATPAPCTQMFGPVINCDAALRNSAA